MPDVAPWGDSLYMVRNYQNKIGPIFYNEISTKTNVKDLKIPYLQPTDWKNPYWMTLYICVCLRFTSCRTRVFVSISGLWSRMLWVVCSISFLTKNNYAVVSSCHELIQPVNHEVDDQNDDQRQNDVQERVHPETVDFQVPIVAPKKQYNSHIWDFGKIKSDRAVKCEWMHRSQFPKLQWLKHFVLSHLDLVNSAYVSKKTWNLDAGAMIIIDRGILESMLTSLHVCPFRPLCRQPNIMFTYHGLMPLQNNGFLVSWMLNVKALSIRRRP